MTSIQASGVHRTWEDWTGIVLGVLIGLSPWMAGQQDHQAVLINSLFIGTMVLLFAEFELVDLHRWQEYAMMACGLWLLASPHVFGYADGSAIVAMHSIFGVMVVLLATIELWQDWSFDDAQLARSRE